MRNNPTRQLENNDCVSDGSLLQISLLMKKKILGIQQFEKLAPAKRGATNLNGNHQKKG